MSTELFQQWSDLWKPPERLPLSKWSEKFFVLSSEYSSRSGPIKLFAYQKAIFDAFTDPSVNELTLMCSTQMTKTLLMQAIIAYTIAVDPAPIILVEPKSDDAKAFSKERITPMLRSMPCLKHVQDYKASKTGQQEILQKDFPGGSLAMVGGISPGNLARRSIRIALIDEVDKLPTSAGIEGDPVSLVKERTVTYGSRKKIVLACSPTLEKSRIHQAFLDGDQREPWVPCPKCGMFQILEWSNVEWDNSLSWEKRPATARYQCPHCQALWDDIERWDAVDKVEWRAKKPFNGHASFTISHLYSPWKSLALMVGDYLAAKHSKSRQRMQVFTNTTLCRPWREEGSAVEESVLYNRREDYPWGAKAIIPKRALLLTAGIDVQPDHLEYEITGWGRQKESWSIDYGVIEALDSNHKRLSVLSPEVWQKLHQLLQKPYKHALGGSLQVWLAAIDTGSQPQPVYEFVLDHPTPSFNASGNIRVGSYGSVVAIKGVSDDLKIISSISNEDAARRRKGVKIVGLGTNCIKSQLFDSLRYLKPEADPETPIANFCHFPLYDIEWFKGLCSEQKVTTEGGKIRFEKRSSQRNEPLDCRVYSVGAAEICGISKMTDSDWDELEERVRRSPVILPGRPTAPKPQRTVRGSFL